MSIGIIGQIEGSVEAVVRNGNPEWAIILRAKQPRESNRLKRAVIFEDQLRMYLEDVTAGFEQHVRRLTVDLYRLFDLGIPTERQIIETVGVIERWVATLWFKAPQEATEEDLGREIGEGVMVVSQEGDPIQTIPIGVTDKMHIRRH